MRCAVPFFGGWPAFLSHRRPHGGNACGCALAQLRQHPPLPPPAEQRRVVSPPPGLLIIATARLACLHWGSSARRWLGRVALRFSLSLGVCRGFFSSFPAVSCARVGALVVGLCGAGGAGAPPRGVRAAWVAWGRGSASLASPVRCGGGGRSGWAGPYFSAVAPQRRAPTAEALQAAARIVGQAGRQSRSPRRAGSRDAHGLASLRA